MEIGVCSHPPAVGVRSQPRRAWGVLAPRSLVPRSSPGSVTALSWRSPFPNQPCSSLSPEPRPPLLPALLPAPPIRSRFFGVLVFPEALQICRARNSLELSRENPFSSLRSDFCCRLFTTPALSGVGSELFKFQKCFSQALFPWRVSHPWICSVLCRFSCKTLDFGGLWPSGS